MEAVLGLQCFGYPSSFELTVNGHLIFSKLKHHGFPNQQLVLERVIEAHHGETPTEIAEAESPGCMIL
ncbi:hypothetical protein ACOMHN_051924 [Nucella lapillus]